MVKDWAELRNGHLDDWEDNGFKSICIDAWKTDDENEEGAVIAKVYGKLVKGESVIFADYPSAAVELGWPMPATHPRVQELVADAKIRMEQILLEEAKAFPKEPPVAVKTPKGTLSAQAGTDSQYPSINLLVDGDCVGFLEYDSSDKQLKIRVWDKGCDNDPNAIVIMKSDCGRCED